MTDNTWLLWPILVGVVWLCLAAGSAWTLAHSLNGKYEKLCEELLNLLHQRVIDERSEENVG